MARWGARTFSGTVSHKGCTLLHCPLRHGSIAWMAVESSASWRPSGLRLYGLGPPSTLGLLCGAARPASRFAGGAKSKGKGTTAKGEKEQHGKGWGNWARPRRQQQPNYPLSQRQMDHIGQDWLGLQALASAMGWLSSIPGGFGKGSGKDSIKGKNISADGQPWL